MASQAMKGRQATTVQKSIRAFNCFSRFSPKWCRISFSSKWIIMVLCSIVLILPICDCVSYQELSPPVSVFVSDAAAAAAVEDTRSLQANMEEGESEKNDDVVVLEVEDELKDDDVELNYAYVELIDEDDELKDEDLELEDEYVELEDEYVELEDDDELEDEDLELEDEDLFKLKDEYVELEDEDVNLNEDEYFDPTSTTSVVYADCKYVQKFPKTELFKEQPNDRKVYDSPAYFGENEMFKTMGFDRYVTVFGIPIVASNSVSDETLKHAVNVFAKFLDNDEDGVPDRKKSVEALRQYNTIIGYISDPEESYNLWTKKFTADINLEFRNQFVCNIHFFEQWSSDVVYSKVVKENDENVCNSGMENEVPFDLSLWYFPFTLTYYGYLEDFDNHTISRIEEFKDKAQQEGVFVARYEEVEMDLADFFVWSLITYLGGLDCHCQSEGISNIWKLCSSTDLKDFNFEWFEVLEKIEGLPKVLPNGKYKSEACVSKF